MDRFGRIDNDVFDKAIRLLCDEQDFFPKNSTILRYLDRVSTPSEGKDFEYCRKCKGTGRVSLILGIKRRKGPNGVYTGRKYVVHREVWTIERQSGFLDNPANAKLAADPDVYITDMSCFCRCKRGRSMYQDAGGGLKLSEMEYQRI